MDIRQATDHYEEWLRKQLTIIETDLKHKHKAMAKDAFSFLRATFYRWMQCWPQVCAGENEATHVLAIGDVHVENFGTWRDAEGRLIWGVNDFDEAYELPYTLDLTRLAASAHIAIRASKLSIHAGDACRAILEGYTSAIQTGGRPFVLEEDHLWLRNIVTGELRDPVHFWQRFDALATLRGHIPGSARKSVERLLPGPARTYRWVHRIAGLGSLGRQRFAAVVVHEGGKMAREVKALAPSACVWAAGGGSGRILYKPLLRQPVRAEDPFLQVKGKWIVRRLSPHCCRVELATLPKLRDERQLLYSMGFEVGNIHLGTRGAQTRILRDLKKRGAGWLHEAAGNMLQQSTRDWKEWRGSTKA